MGRGVLVAREYSGAVRDAFLRVGVGAVSCDLLPSESDAGEHIIGDAVEVAAGEAWDAVIAFPPCTHLCASGARWWSDKVDEQAQALDFVSQLMSCGAPRIAIENPIGKISTAIRKPDQIVQPWMFGHGETKATCLWLDGLPPLQPTNIVSGREPRVHRMPPSKDRWRERSRTYSGIADAMATQWGPLIG